ncbi:hydrogenase expression/formation protein HypE [Bacillus sp. HMF5848]|uniref:hydrogenase expression/formation protein HypE n=1 Tax=Bacillus sp. HMF5848 TaxID=2495421 RepID=UPI000F793EB5|nr:hydrogenase expression/formation protein HypE [Bacillus sp. HMF5848]RSK27288.1 hydrogenase expression/formation protein HypE [Bacillus sp. HMF5848]
MKEQRISLAHGDGGDLAHKLILDIFVSQFGNKAEATMDSALLELPVQNIAFTTDSFVVKPIFFPGGNIGKLAVAGTVNDLAVAGAKPIFMSTAFIIEEGFLVSDLKTIVKSMAEEAGKVGIKIVAGDTKVVERGSADGVFINTTGLGVIQPPGQLNPLKIKKDDVVIVSGPIGDHGIAILTARGELGIQSTVKSDCASLSNMINKIMDNCQELRIMRDPTRGGLATTLVEICEDFNVTIQLEEERIPIRDTVHGACDILGFDPLYLANEGKVIIICSSEEEEKVLSYLKQHSEGEEAVAIGKVQSNDRGQLLLQTPLGTTRRLHRLSGMMLPRIC